MTASISVSVNSCPAFPTPSISAISTSPTAAAVTTHLLPSRVYCNPTNRLRNRGPLEVDMDVSVGFASNPFDLTIDEEDEPHQYPVPGSSSRPALRTDSAPGSGSALGSTATSKARARPTSVFEGVLSTFEAQQTENISEDSDDVLGCILCGFA
ncbi:hypothetical protein K435DRAFT_857741 [Dendrothele bispora CBS 962.96]|uniref:Uncharacterized protein n=1 Tax=Dendrothele bispora (strain CBS 962.96) TaxID=1314807 RepID=A0A4S8M550_DENBC|nr:hypothetical protein K435DRAFT_857741 [Dendrothele bispora CBS 962.96]